MSSEYTTLQKSEDATAFAQSRFGKHYIARLKSLRADARAIAENPEFTDSYRAHHSTKAATLSDEIEYFRIAQSIIENEGIVAKLRAKLKKKKEVVTEDV